MKSLIKHLAKETQLGIDANSKARTGMPHRIKYRGKYIRTRSQKTVWPSKGAASNALRLELERCFEGLVREDFIYANYSGRGERKCYQLIVKATGDKLDPMSYKERLAFLDAYFTEVKKEIEIVPVSADDFHAKRNPYK